MADNVVDRTSATDKPVVDTKGEQAARPPSHSASASTPSQGESAARPPPKTASAPKSKGVISTVGHDIQSASMFVKGAAQFTVGTAAEKFKSGLSATSVARVVRKPLAAAADGALTAAATGKVMAGAAAKGVQKASAEGADMAGQAKAMLVKTRVGQQGRYEGDRLALSVRLVTEPNSQHMRLDIRELWDIYTSRITGFAEKGACSYPPGAWLRAEPQAGKTYFKSGALQFLPGESSWINVEVGWSRGLSKLIVKIKRGTAVRVEKALKMKRVNSADDSSQSEVPEVPAHSAKLEEEAEELDIALIARFAEDMETDAKYSNSMADELFEWCAASDGAPEPGGVIRPGLSAMETNVQAIETNMQEKMEPLVSGIVEKLQRISLAITHSDEDSGEGNFQKIHAEFERTDASSTIATFRKKISEEKQNLRVRLQTNDELKQFVKKKAYKRALKHAFGVQATFPLLAMSILRQIHVQWEQPRFGTAHYSHFLETVGKAILESTTVCAIVRIVKADADRDDDADAEDDPPDDDADTDFDDERIDAG
eukprot:gnl/TRDRNA2_/TRDRNA2_166917_c1_seq2.p1 gnl/TRDRNA2_/TRDRNA2_166917_c1~~gnl/TRDRNA2_/TRDRNA2_166917_c1_seq2.p1  ORF type:complete len:563 (-),score=86.81 gnl/TRDRNA2_/TRDRNA2_166917_c1_seq2:128-1750(-)